MNTLNFAIELAKEAGKTLQKFYSHSGFQASLKSDRTVVTEADYAADQLLRAAVHKAYPQDGVLSEEQNTVYPENKEYVWIIDPLDGTTNFSLGLHYWGISISRLKYGRPDLGVLYFPLLDELFSAARRGGTTLNGSQLRVSADIDSLPAAFFSCCSRTHRNYEVGIRYKTRILGSAAYGLATVARGSSIYALEVTPKVWDFAASWLITQEAGGYVAPLDGDSPFPLVPGFDYEDESYPLFVAPTPEMWDKGRRKIRERKSPASR